MFNKKANVGEGINLTIAAVIIILLMLIFILLSSWITGGNSRDMKEESEDLTLKQQAENSLISYLKTPISTELQKMTMADMIRLAQDDGMYEGILVKETKDIFDKIYGDYSLSAGKIEIKTTTENVGTAGRKIAFIDIPSINNKTLRIILMIK